MHVIINEKKKRICFQYVGNSAKPALLANLANELLAILAKGMRS